MTDTGFNGASFLYRILSNFETLTQFTQTVRSV